MTQDEWSDCKDPVVNAPRTIKFESFHAICIYEPEGMIKGEGIITNGNSDSSMIFVPVFIPH